jgi:hypothetical protein
MGFEYDFKITRQDIENLSRSPGRINSLDELLRSAPYFKEKSGSTYTYNEEPREKGKWPSTISLQEYGFCLCIHDQSPGSKDVELMDYLIHELLDRCGHVEIEDA